VTPTSSGYSSPDDEFAEAHWHPPPPKPNSGSWSSTESESSTDLGPDWDNWINSEDPPTPRPAAPKEFGQAHADQVGHVDPPSAHSPLSGAGSPTEPGESEVIQVTTRLPPLASPDSGLNSFSADSQPEDLRTAILAAIYAARGKAKESRHISGTAGDVGNAT
jgi:hypothetical protein